jgi:hypothetical protein
MVARQQMLARVVVLVEHALGWIEQDPLVPDEKLQEDVPAKRRDMLAEARKVPYPIGVHRLNPNGRDASRASEAPVEQGKVGAPAHRSLVQKVVGGAPMVAGAVVPLSDVLVEPLRDGEQFVVIALTGELAGDAPEAIRVADARVEGDVLLRVRVVDLPERRSVRVPRATRLRIVLVAGGRARRNQERHQNRPHDSLDSRLAVSALPRIHRQN